MRSPKQIEFFSVLLTVFTVAATLGIANAEELFVGAAQVDITPPVGFRTGGGYGEVISTGIIDPLYAKALVIRHGETAAAVVISDLLSVPPDLCEKARHQVHEKTRLPAKNIVIAATHNHGSPEYWGSLRDIAHEAARKEHGHDPHEMLDYQGKLVAAWVEAICKADQYAVPATMELAVQQQPGLAFNRRFHMKDGTVRFNPGAMNPDIVRPAGPVDDELPVLLFRGQDSQQTAIASLTTFAMHTAVHGGTTFSGDFPAVLQARLRSSLGSNFISLFAEGTAGDVNHIDVQKTDQLKGRPEVQRIGNVLSQTVSTSLAEMKSLDFPCLAVVSKTVFAPFQTITKPRYDESRTQLSEQRLPFLTLVAAWRDCHRYRFSKLYPDGKKPLEIQAMRLDSDTAIVALPHEVFAEIGMAIKATSPFRSTIVISLSGDVDFYIPTRRAFTEGSYEVTTCPLEPGCGDILLDGARVALMQLHESGT